MALSNMTPTSLLPVATTAVLETTDGSILDVETREQIAVLRSIRRERGIHGPLADLRDAQAEQLEAA